MEKYISIDLSNEDVLSPYDKVAGAKGESFVRGIDFTLPADKVDWDVFVDIKNAAGEAYRQEIVGVQNGHITYEFSSVDLAKRGRLFLDLVLVHTDDNDSEKQYIAKPFRGEFAVKEAIDASDFPPGGNAPILTEALRSTITELLDITKNTKFSMFLDMDEDEDGNFVYKNKTYINTDSLADALSDKITASVVGEKLILTSGGGN